MKTTKTILAVALLIVGFAYVSYAYPPTLGTVDQCCGPQPEDFRSYRLQGTGVLIPSVEGENGMIITDVVCVTSVIAVTTCSLRTAPGEDFVTLRLDAGAGGEWTRSVHFQSGLPVPAGAEIFSSSQNTTVTVSGYVY